MAKFIVFYHAPAAAMQSMATATPEEKEAGLGAWMAWKEKVGNAVVDFGNPFMPGEICGADGNFSPAMNEITGYSIMEADSADALKAMLKNHPHLQWWDGCKIEYKPCVNM
ncbi:MAG: DUF3303 domain-containing protein [Saprospiraceae bacterium]|nr:DUF3303 domain-containing protein [Saprospiraceae bacterium]